MYFIINLKQVTALKKNLSDVEKQILKIIQNYDNIKL